MARNTNTNAVALGLLLATSPAALTAAEYAPNYAFLQGNATAQLNTHNDDKLEASAEILPSLEFGAGWMINDYLAVETRFSWKNQRAHGCNENQCGVKKSSINGRFYTFDLQFGGLAHYPNKWVTPYARAGVGPGYFFADTTRASIGNQRGNDNGFSLAYTGAIGLERAIGNELSVRLEAGYANTYPIEQEFVGLAVIYHIK